MIAVYLADKRHRVSKLYRADEKAMKRDGIVQATNVISEQFKEPMDSCLLRMMSSMRC